MVGWADFVYIKKVQEQQVESYSLTESGVKDMTAAAHNRKQPFA